jgi:hypothetical protein
MWCPAPLPEGELLVEVDGGWWRFDEDTDIEVGGDTGTGPDAGGAAKSRCKTRSAVAKQ